MKTEIASPPWFPLGADLYQRVRRTGRSLLVAILATALALALSALLIEFQGVRSRDAISTLLEGAWGSAYAIGNTLNAATDLLLVALGVIVALRAGLLNIGGEGQILGGAVLALLAANLVSLPWPIHVPVALLAAAIGGAMLGLLAAVLKVSRGVSEVISTLLLNLVAFWFVSYLLHGPLMENQGSVSLLPQSAPVAESARLPHPFHGSFLNAGVFLAIALAILVSWALRRTTFGMGLKMVGANPKAAHDAGVVIGRITLAALAVSGALCGLAGGVMLLGEQYRIQDGFSPGYGFDGIVVALLARESPVGAVLAAILLGALRSGGFLMETRVGVPSALVLVTQGLVVVFVAAGALLVERRGRPSRLQILEHD